MSFILKSFMFKKGSNPLTVFVFKLHEFNPFVQLTKEQRVLQTEVLFENFELIHFNCLHVIETLVS